MGKIGRNISDILYIILFFSDLDLSLGPGRHLFAASLELQAPDAPCSPAAGQEDRVEKA